MVARKSFLVVLTVDRDVESMFGSESRHHFLDVLHAHLTVSHSLSGVVAVTAGPIPVREELRGKGYVNVVVLSYSVEKVARHVEHVTDCDRLAGSDLVLPLTGHNLSVRARDLNSSVKASLVVGISD